MGPAKPALAPLKTPKTVTFPSELHENTHKDSTKRTMGGNPTPISPPPAYTEFLKTFSPTFSSPSSASASFPSLRLDQPRRSSTSVPSSAMSTSFSTDTTPTTGSGALPSPTATPHSARELPSLQRLRIPDSAAPKSPQTGHSMQSPFSPAEWRFRCADSPRSANGGSVSVRQTTRRTVTFRYTPSLDPPPKGKRRKTAASRSPPRSP